MIIKENMGIHTYTNGAKDACLILKGEDDSFVSYQLGTDKERGYIRIDCSKTMRLGGHELSKVEGVTFYDKELFLEFVKLINNFAEQI